MAKHRRRATRHEPPPSPVQVIEHTRVGNLGCIRFPLAIRKASGIKRGDRLVARPGDDSSIVLSKLPLGLPMTSMSVDECACQKKPAGCSTSKSYLEVGWSYVHFDPVRAQELGLLPGAPLTLVAEPFRITFSVDRSLSRSELDALSPVRCPP